MSSWRHDLGPPPSDEPASRRPGAARSARTAPSRDATPPRAAGPRPPRSRTPRRSAPRPPSCSRPASPVPQGEAFERAAGADGEGLRPAARGPLRRPRDLVAGLQRARPGARRGPGPAAAGARALPGDLRLEPRRVLHGPGRRPQAPHRHRHGRDRRVRALPAPGPRGHRRARRTGSWSATPPCSSTRSSPRWPTRASPWSTGTSSARTSRSGCASTSAARSSRC